MARISTYSSDSSITGSEKLLGTDSGTTKLFTLSDLDSYFTNTITLSSSWGAHFLPETDGSYNLGSAILEWQDLYVDGIAYIDQLGTDADATTAYISGGEVDNAVIGGETPAAGTFTTLNATTLQVGGSAISLNDLSNVLIADNSLYIGNDPSSTDSTAAYNIAVGTTALTNITTGDNNTVVGYNAGTAVNTGAGLVLLGFKAGEALTSGTNHVAIGYEALLEEDTSTDGNVAVGYRALKTQNGGGYNVAVGFDAGLSVSSGSDNVLVGAYAGDAVTTGADNIAIGTGALGTEDGHGKNVAIGKHSLLVLNAGADGLNTAVGYETGKAMLTGLRNTLVGYQSGLALTTGSDNVAIGQNALVTENTGAQNVAIGNRAADAFDYDGTGSLVAVGYDAATALTTGIGNTMLGHTAGGSVTTGAKNVMVGYNAGGTSNAGTANNVFIGWDTGAAGGEKENNVAVGSEALNNLSTGDNNVAIGSQAGYVIGTGTANVVIGKQAGKTLENSTGAVAIGYQALYTEDSAQSTAIGYQALYTQDAGTGHNTAIGYWAGKLITDGSSNVLVGEATGNALTSGDENVAVGDSALAAEDGHGRNVAIGHQALLVQNAGVDAYNVAVGWKAGHAVSTGHENVLLGGKAGEAITSGDDNVIIGYDAESSGATTDNEIVIGKGAAGQGANKTVIGNTSTLGAHVYGLRTPVTAITGDTSITANDSGETFVFNDADGAVITLPDSGGGDLTGVYFNFYIAVTITSNSHKVVCTDTTNEKLYGQLHAVDADADASSSIWAAQAGDSFSAITTDGTTKAQIGSHFTVTNMAADVWHVTGNIHCAGTPATPFATS